MIQLPELTELRTALQYPEHQTLQDRGFITVNRPSFSCLNIILLKDSTFNEIRERSPKDFQDLYNFSIAIYSQFKRQFIEKIGSLHFYRELDKEEFFLRSDQTYLWEFDDIMVYLSHHYDHDFPFKIFMTIKERKKYEN